eukprot:7229241-Pyramimonas_sp.AAC.1
MPPHHPFRRTPHSSHVSWPLAPHRAPPKAPAETFAPRGPLEAVCERSAGARDPPEALCNVIHAISRALMFFSTELPPGLRGSGAWLPTTRCEFQFAELVKRRCERPSLPCREAPLGSA